MKDLRDGMLDRGAVVIAEVGGECEGGGAGALSAGGRGDGPAGGVVVVAELFCAKGGAAAAAAIGEDVTALEAGRFCGLEFGLADGVEFDHVLGTPLPGDIAQSIQSV